MTTGTLNIATGKTTGPTNIQTGGSGLLTIGATGTTTTINGRLNIGTGYVRSLVAPTSTSTVDLFDNLTGGTINIANSYSNSTTVVNIQTNVGGIGNDTINIGTSNASVINIGSSNLYVTGNVNLSNSYTISNIRLAANNFITPNSGNNTVPAVGQIGYRYSFYNSGVISTALTTANAIVPLYTAAIPAGVWLVEISATSSVTAASCYYLSFSTSSTANDFTRGQMTIPGNFTGVTSANITTTVANTASTNYSVLGTRSAAAAVTITNVTIFLTRLA
jgi:hypothetical protein